MVAVIVDGLAFDVFENQIRSVLGCDAGIDELGDMRVGKLPEDASFLTKALLAVARRQGKVEELGGAASLEASIDALRQPHYAHAALTKRRDQAVWSDRLSGEGGG